MNREQRIKSTLVEALDPKAFEIVNESHMHSGPRTESHFKVFAVSDVFNEKNRVERQQFVYALLKDEFDKKNTDPLHALSLRLKTPEEVESSLKAFESPKCKTKLK